jgi:hypothetical protein
MRDRLALPSLCLCLLVSSLARAAPLVLEGDLPTDGPDFVLVPFEVPAGTVEVEVRHAVVQTANILDYGLHDPVRYRGWGGGNVEPIIVGVDAASRSYLPGALPAGTWNVVIGKAKVVTAPAKYHLEVELRTVATLAAQPQRRAYSAVAALEATARWYAGDLHVHSLESGDAQPTIDAIATFARARGLDFVELSDHNTVAQLDFMGDVQPRHPQLLLLPGVEFTTYAGHANGIGATAYVDHRFGVGAATFDAAVQAFAGQRAVFSINHPMLDLGMSCIGCAWKQKVPRDTLGAVEIGTGGWDKTGLLFTKQAIAYWDRLVANGLHVAPVGGSDDHSGGLGMGQFDSPIGSPTTMVFASELSAAGIVDAIRAGHTVVKLQGPLDPMVDVVAATGARVGDVVQAPSAGVGVTFTVTQGVGTQLVVLLDGAEVERQPIGVDPFTFSKSFVAPATGQSRLRAEVWVDGQPRTVTNHLFLEAAPEKPKSGCAVGDGLVVWAGLALLSRRARRP